MGPSVIRHPHANHGDPSPFCGRCQFH